MSNERDSGLADGSQTNVRIDFVWGNIPLQPNDDRADELVYELDSHSIAIDGYAGYPKAVSAGFVQVPQVRMPESFQSYSDFLATFGLVAAEGAVLPNTVNETLNGQVSTTNPPVGTIVPVGTSVAINVLGAYAPPGSPIAGMRTDFIPGAWSLNLGDIVMYLNGRTPRPYVGQVIKVQGNSNNSLNQGYNVVDVADDDSFNTGGTAVWLRAFEKAYMDPNTNEGGIWKDYFA